LSWYLERRPDEGGFSKRFKLDMELEVLYCEA